MRSILQTGVLALVAAMLVSAAACSSGGGSNDQSSEKPAGGDAAELVASNPTVALAASSERFKQNVESLQADFTFTMAAGGFSMGGNGDFAYKSPDQLYMKMNLTGAAGAGIDFSQFGAFELLVLGDRIYMHVPFVSQDWAVASLGDFGADAEKFKEMLAGHSPFDYQGLVKKLGGQVENLGQEPADGHSYQHYRVTVDVANVMDALSDAFGSSGTVDASSIRSGGFSGPITMEMWVDTDTLLPHKLTAAGAFDVKAQHATFAMTMNFREYNGTVKLPDAPQDAKPFKDLFGDFKLKAGS